MNNDTRAASLHSAKRLREFRAALCALRLLATRPDDGDLDTGGTTVYMMFEMIASLFAASVLCFLFLKKY